MVQQNTLLVMLVQLVDTIPVPVPVPLPPAPAKRSRGRPTLYSDRLFLKALVIMIIKHLHSPYELLCVLEQPTLEMQSLRLLLTEGGRYPTRRTWERRLKALPAKLPAQLGCLGRHLVHLIKPWAHTGRAVVVDSTILRAKGLVWHKAERERGDVPDTRIDTEAHWARSGWHGWVYGWKLHIISVVADEWIPLVGCLTPGNVSDSDQQVIQTLTEQLPNDQKHEDEDEQVPDEQVPDEQVRFLLGDRHYDTDNVKAQCQKRNIVLVAPRYGGRYLPYPHTDEGVEVRRMFHKLRSVAIENFNEHFKGIFGAHEQVPTRGLSNTTRFALGALFVYQLALLYRFEHGLQLNAGLKPFLKAA